MLDQRRRPPLHHLLSLLGSIATNTRQTLTQCWGNVRSASTQDIDPMLGQRWTSVYNAGPTLPQHWINVSCLLGYEHINVYKYYCTYICFNDAGPTLPQHWINVSCLLGHDHIMYINTTILIFTTPIDKSDW